MLRRWIKRLLAALVTLMLAALAWDIATYDAETWLADYRRLKRDMAQGYANLDWMVEHRGIDLPALDRATTAKLENAHSRVRAFLALRGFVRGFGDPHFRLKPGRRSASAPSKELSEAVLPESEEEELVDPPAGPNCAAAGYEEGDHSFRFPFSRLPGWSPLRDGDFPTGLVGDTGVLRIAQFGEDRYLAACQAVFRPGIGVHALKVAVRARQQALLGESLAELQAKGARRLLVDVSGNGGGTEWVSEVIALMTERTLTRREARLVGPRCDRSVVWRGETPVCEVFQTQDDARATLQGRGQWRGPVLILADRGTGSAAEDFVIWLKQNGVARVIGERTAGAGCGYVNGGNPTRLSVVPVEVWMPNCARFLDDGTNEVEGIVPDMPLTMSSGSAEARAQALLRILANAAGKASTGDP